LATSRIHEETEMLDEINAQNGTTDVGQEECPADLLAAKQERPPPLTPTADLLAASAREGRPRRRN
jgi:hypothetical protein